MNFGDIFAEYFSQFRGQATSIPVFGDREYTLGIYLANAAIRKWDRVDGVLWRELFDRAQDQSTAIFPATASVLSSGTLSYAAPTNMRKPPKEVWLFNNGQYQRIEVTKPEQTSGLNELHSDVTFLGSANGGYTMKISQHLSDQYDGWNVDYLYVKKPTFFTIATTPAAMIPEMSDPNFMIQDMLVTRHTSNRNGFGVKVASSEAKAALLNMKIENSSGVPGRSDNWGVDVGWGKNEPVGDIKL